MKSLFADRVPPGYSATGHTETTGLGATLRVFLLVALMLVVTTLTCGALLTWMIRPQRVVPPPAPVIQDMEMPPMPSMPAAPPSPEPTLRLTTPEAPEDPPEPGGPLSTQDQAKDKTISW